MIGAILHLWQRAVDRLAGADAASLRVTLAALSARVAVAEGEAERLRHRLWEADARAVSLQEKIDDWDRRYLEADRGNHAAEKKLTAERDEARAEAASLRWRVDEEKKRAAQDKDEITRSTGHALATASASVAAAEGEVARLRAELAGLRQTDHDVRTWCEQAADAMDAAYAAGFRYGVDHPGEAFRDARDLGIFLDDQRLRVEWAHGRQDEAAARRLGEDTRAMLDAGVQGPSLTDPALVIVRLLDERDAARVKVERLRADAETTTAQSIAEWGRLKRRANEAMDTCDQMAKERDEALQWRGVAASVEREAAEDRARLEEAIRERDELRAAAQAFVDALDHGDCDNVFKCDADRCHRVASQRTLDPYGDYCDEHAESMSPVDKSFAPALRALRAALPAEGAGDG